MQTFDEWMRSHEPKHCDSDDSISLRLLRKCWDAAKKNERDRCVQCCKRIGLAIHGPGREDSEAFDCADAIEEGGQS